MKNQRLNLRITVYKRPFKTEIGKEITHLQNVEDDIGRWVSLIKEYVGLEELDRELLLNKIIAGQKQTIDGVDRQEISIRYNFVGEI